MKTISTCLLVAILATGCVSEPPVALDPLKAIEKATAPVFKALGATTAPTIMRDANPLMFSWEFNTRHTPVGTNGVIRIQPALDGLWLTAELWLNDYTVPKAPMTEPTSYGFLYSCTVRAGETDTLNVHLQYGPKANREAVEAIIKRIEKVEKRSGDKVPHDDVDKDDKESGGSSWQEFRTWWHEMNVEDID